MKRRIYRFMSQNPDRRLDERHNYKLSTVGKMFIAGIAAWLLGNKTRLKIRGKKEDIDKLVNALMASKRFQNELSRPGATAESVIQKLNLKNMTVQEFERELGIPWPL